MNKPTFGEHLEAAVKETLRKLTRELLMLDVEIESWAEQLDRAPPIVSGRIVIVFTRNALGQSFRTKGNRCIDVSPSVAKLVKARSKDWRLVWLGLKQLAKGLVELRVGRSYASDRVVARLLEGLQELLDHRKAIVKMVSEMRLQFNYALKKSEYGRKRRDVRLSKLFERIKTDWKADPDAAMERVRAENAERYQRRKAKKALDAILAEAKKEEAIECSLQRHWDERAKLMSPNS